MQSLIAIKGSRDGLRLVLDTSAEWSGVLDALRNQLQQGASFFNGAQLTVDIGERVLNEQEFGAMLALMAEHGIQPEALAASTRESRDTARAAGVTPRPAVRPVANDADDGRGDAQLIWRTLRSGQFIRHQGSVTVIGDVNAGAEIVAGGSVIIWGRLRGTIHAGALGDRSAVICALEFAPMQLRIADVIARTPGGEPDPIPEIAQIEADRITVGSWKTFRR